MQDVRKYVCTRITGLEMQNKESPESHWSSGSSTAATLTATVSDDIVHDGDDDDE